MPYALRTFTCPECGEPVTRRRKGDAEVRCIRHAIGRSVENAYQQQNKAGEFYRRWAAAMERAAAEARILADIGADIDGVL